MIQSPVIDFGQVLDVARAYGLISATVTIKENTATGVLGTAGTWVNRAGLVDLPCMAAADIMMTRISQSQEVRKQDRTGDVDRIQVVIDGLYPTITKGNHAVITQGAVTREFEITGIEQDSQATYTRLAVREYRL